jgi:tetratricopeptide (TPR) repeat protein
VRWNLSASLVFAAIVSATPATYAQGTPAKPAKPDKAEKAEKDKTEAQRLKKDADALMDQDRYVDALALYARAYDLSGDPALLYNQGRALEAMGEYGDALDKLERFEKEAGPALRAKVPGLHDLISDLRGRLATIVVTTNAPGARLLVRDKAAGTIQKEAKIRTRAGSATIEVVAEGYVSFKKDVDLTPGSVIKVDAQLALKKSDALLVIRSRPTADIAIDGKPFGRAPLELHLPAGSHALSADAEGYQSEKVQMTLALGDRREVEIELRKQSGILSRWWFWTAAGVVIAGGVATALALTIEKSPTPGTFGAGRGVYPGP